MTTTMANSPVEQLSKTLTLASIAFAARIFAFDYKDQIRQRVEIVTPISDWKRANEAIHLWNSGLDPYSSAIFHEYPISLQFYKMVSACIRIEYAFAATDVITAILLQRAVRNQLLINQKYREVAKSCSLKVLLIYLFSPINILSCAGMSTSIFTNFLIAVIYLILPMQPFKALTCVICAFLACHNIHYSSLILPIFLCMEYCSQKQRQNQVAGEQTPYYATATFSSSITTSLGICLASCVVLILTSYVLMGNSWTFLGSTYLFVMRVQDLTPNIGMLWYLFTEMFDQFLEFFTCIVQINAFVHVIPLSIYLRDHPFYAFYCMIVTATIFQPYPSLCNVGLITSLLPQWSEHIEHMRHGLKIFCTAITSISLWPIFWHLWIIMGTANSNFYFGATLAFTIALILFTWDLFYAHDSLIRFKMNPETREQEKFAQNENLTS